MTTSLPTRTRRNRRADDAQYAHVVSKERLTPSLIRIVLGGGTLDTFEAPDATDAYINARFPPAGSPITVPFSAEDLDRVDADQRPRPRRFTIRRWDRDRRELTIDFVHHGDTGYAGSWAHRAEPGEGLQFSGPGGSYAPAADVDWHLLIGDESAFGAIGATLETLPASARALVFAVVDGPEHEIEFPTEAEASVVWLHRRSAADPDSMLLDAIVSAEFPSGSFDVFLHGEAGEVRTVRAHLASDRGVDVGAQSISPYWRRNHDDEEWRAVKRAWLAEQSRDV